MSTDPARRRRGSVASDVLIRLRKDLQAGAYYPRERLVEAELADRYGVARSSIRSALFLLAREGLVEHEPNRGARVRQVSIDEAIEIAEVRILLQGLCFVRAAEHATAEQKKELLGALGRLRDVVDGQDIDAVIDEHMAISALTREMAGHELAGKLIDQLLSQRVPRQFPFVLPERRVDSLHEMEQIVDAIVASDVAATEEATRLHLKRLVEALEGIKDTEPATAADEIR